jgi:hypothetical protein
MGKAGEKHRAVGKRRVIAVRLHAKAQRQHNRQRQPRGLHRADNRFRAAAQIARPPIRRGFQDKNPGDCGRCGKAQRGPERAKQGQ